jgi:hypothetical protein
MKVEDIIKDSRVENYKPISTPQMLADFMESTIYEDFLRELNLRILQMVAVMPEMPKDKYLETKGGIEALKLNAPIFENLYNNALADRELEIKKQKEAEEASENPTEEDYDY